MKRKHIIGIIIGLLLILIPTALYLQYNRNPQQLSYIEFKDKVSNGDVEKVVLSDQATVQVILKDNDKERYTVPNPRTADFKEYLLVNGIEVTEGNQIGYLRIIQSALMFFLFGGIFFFVYKQMGRGPQGGTMQAKFTAEENSYITFEDVAGNLEAKEAVQDVVDFLRAPEKYTKYGARMPKGIIFYGPPGTGKTLMAKAIATEAGVPFYSVSGSDFVQMYVGVGAGRVRELFKNAREHGKAVIFIDEIDALGKARSSNGMNGNDERDQTLNALLTEMSGFKEREGIVVIAATNRLDILDSALLRPGRFDRQVEIALPDFVAREKILKLHSRNKPLNESVNMRSLAKQTVYFSGAMLENLLNEAAIFAAKDNARFIDMYHIDKAFYTVVAGAEKKDRSMINEKDRRITAFHEAGHALVTKLVAPQNTVSKVTIIPSAKGAGGFSMNIPPDKMYYTKKDMQNQVMVSLGGRAAEEIIFGKEEITTGASNDIEKATNVVHDFVHKYGMSESIGLVNLEKFNQSDKAWAECRSIIHDLYKETKELLIEKKYFLDKIAEALLVKESLNEEDIERIMAGEDIIEESFTNIDLDKKKLFHKEKTIEGAL